MTDFQALAAQFEPVREIFQCLRIRRRFNIPCRVAMHNVVNGHLDGLATFRARNVGDLYDFRGNMSRRGVAANVILDFLHEHFIQRHAFA